MVVWLILRCKRVRESQRFHHPAIHSTARLAHSPTTLSWWNHAQASRKREPAISLQDSWQIPWHYMEPIHWHQLATRAHLSTSELDNFDKRKNQTIKQIKDKPRGIQNKTYLRHLRYWILVTVSLGPYLDLVLQKQSQCSRMWRRFITKIKPTADCFEDTRQK